MGEGGGDGGGNSDDGNNYDDDNNDALEWTLQQRKRITGANVCRWPQQQCIAMQIAMKMTRKVDY